MSHGLSPRDLDYYSGNIPNVLIKGWEEMWGFNPIDIAREAVSRAEQNAKKHFPLRITFWVSVAGAGICAFLPPMFIPLVLLFVVVAIVAAIVKGSYPSNATQVAENIRFNFRTFSKAFALFQSWSGKRLQDLSSDMPREALEQCAREILVTQAMKILEFEGRNKAVPSAMRDEVKGPLKEEFKVRLKTLQEFGLIKWNEEYGPYFDEAQKRLDERKTA